MTHVMSHFKHRSTVASPLTPVYNSSLYNIHTQLALTV